MLVRHGVRASDKVYLMAYVRQARQVVPRPPIEKTKDNYAYIYYNRRAYYMTWINSNCVSLNSPEVL
jgi:hypothetical protein